MGEGRRVAEGCGEGVRVGGSELGMGVGWAGRVGVQAARIANKRMAAKRRRFMAEIIIHPHPDGLSRFMERIRIGQRDARKI